MTTDDQQQETNQAIFDEYVRYLIGGTDAVYMDESIEHIIETIEHREASVETAINLIARAHVIFMVLTCPTQLNFFHDSEIDDLERSVPWIVQLIQLVPKIGPALDRCADLLQDLPIEHAEEESAGISSVIETAMLPHLFSAPSLKKLTSKKLFGNKGALDLFVFAARAKASSQSVREQIDDGEEALTTDLGHLARLNLDIKPSLRALPNWYWYRVSHEISECLSETKSLTFHEWQDIVNFVADLMRQSEEENNIWSDIEYKRGMDAPYPVWSAENWAWQFGRVASLYHIAEPDPEALIDKPPAEVGFEIELLQGWDNGLAVQSLIAQGPSLGGLEEFDQLEAGLYAARSTDVESLKESIEQGDALLPSMQPPTSRLYWIMRLGYLEGAERSREPREERASKMATIPMATQQVTDVDALLQSVDLEDRPRDVSVNKPAEGENPVVTVAEEVETGLREALPDIWDKLPRDVRRYLRLAEQSLLGPPTVVTYPALEYAKSVEAALGILLRKPQELPRNLWPHKRIGKWIEALEGMTGKLSEFDPLQLNLRNQFDAAYAPQLAESLKIVAENRNSEAHDEDEVSLPHLVRDTVLGTDTRPSIFELILRFAKRMRD